MNKTVELVIRVLEAALKEDIGIEPYNWRNTPEGAPAVVTLNVYHLGSVYSEQCSQDFESGAYWRSGGCGYTERQGYFAKRVLKAMREGQVTIEELQPIFDMFKTRCNTVFDAKYSTAGWLALDTLANTVKISKKLEVVA